MKGIKATNEEIAPQGAFDLPNTGPALTVKTQNGRNPSSTNIPMTRRVDHSSLESTRMGETTEPSQETGKTNNGPYFKDTKKGPSVRNVDSGVGTGPTFK